jgi:Lamin Tail Domain
MQFRPALVRVLAALGVAAAISVSAPAHAATTPTLSGPSSRTGFGTVTLTGTADPGATVTLLESAIGWNDLQPAVDWENDGGTVTRTADTTGHFSIVRYVDSGFMFAVEADGVRSATELVYVQVLPGLWMQSPGVGQVTANVDVSPNQPGLPVRVQRASGGSWVTVATGETDIVGDYVATVSGQPAGPQTYRAYVGGDATQGVTANYSPTREVTVTGSTPTPKAGDVQFTYVVYNPAGADTSSNTQLNKEYVRVTNRTTKAINLKGWTIRDKAGNVYTFSTSLSLAAKASAWVLTGKGTNNKPVNHRYWGRTTYVWNNGGDAAYLRTGTGKAIDSCSWGAGTGYTSC